MKPRLTIKGDTENHDHIHVILTRGRRREQKLTRSEFAALVTVIVKDSDMLSQIGAGNVMSVDIDESNVALRSRSNNDVPTILINGIRPLALTKAEFYAVIRSPRIAQRALYWTRRGKSYVKIFREGGRGTTLLIDTKSIEHFYGNILIGRNIPPAMPCEEG